METPTTNGNAPTATPPKPAVAEKMEKKIATEYVICRVCGYIEKADEADKPCPACGFPSTVWMEYKPRKMNAQRAKLLGLHLHPIAVHFPIVGSTLSFVLPLLALLVPYTLAFRLFDFTTLVAMVLPLLVLVGAVSGYIGGKMRYKTTTASALKKKMYLSIIYFVLSLIQSYMAWTSGIHVDNALIMIALGIVSSVFAAVLGKMGSYLFAGRFGPYTAG
ncbi:hypothetical protein RVY78_05770 [Veillonella sp. YH-vei2232]|uniref:Rubrerythrin rubredoxin-like domain-containing protein n=1 Tax=Veillonella absiana TaxID=3079305 RepID=A0ABU3Z667_9FIRM|nr:MULTISPECIES: hypothetical protein [unclassified Veillonella]MDV5063474.1 hypothetical protein [Veillonella sp. YH-vei2232]MDV5087416.1 hypothetical protein [Veillonella sp. YH-vei2233]